MMLVTHSNEIDVATVVICDLLSAALSLSLSVGEFAIYL